MTKNELYEINSGLKKLESLRHDIVMLTARTNDDVHVRGEICAHAMCRKVELTDAEVAFIRDSRISQYDRWVQDLRRMGYEDVAEYDENDPNNTPMRL
jgi:hypothetical protein